MARETGFIMAEKMEPAYAETGWGRRGVGQGPVPGPRTGIFPPETAGRWSRLAVQHPKNWVSGYSL